MIGSLSIVTTNVLAEVSKAETASASIDAERLSVDWFLVREVSTRRVRNNDNS